MEFRLILDPPRSATLNMAIDEYLMLSQGHPNSKPTLRFYTWQDPACSVGYFQNLSQIIKKYETKNKKMSFVRRLTGGGMVLHGQDLTFSLTIAVDNPFLGNNVKESYLKINEVLRGGLLALAPQIDYADCKTVPSGRGTNERICFDAPSCYDLLISGKKVVGASQRRVAGAILHQSSIFMKHDKQILVQNILEGFKKLWKVNFKETSLNDEEISRALQIQGQRYQTHEWAVNC